jgi:K+/H+ antiporter YhaU regulatory subunit KhtT
LEYFEDGEDLNFDGVMAEKHRRKLYQVDYTIQSAKHLMGSQDKEVSQVASILGKCVCGKLDSGATLPSLLAFFPGKRKIF